MPAPIKTALERLLLTERHRRQADLSALAGFAQPMLSERAMDVTLEPLVASNSRGQLVGTRVSRARGVARYGFFECMSEDEGALLPRFFRDLWELSRSSGWANRCSSLLEATSKMVLQPRSIVVPYDLVERISNLSRAEVDRLMSVQGYIAKGEQQILAADLPPGHAILAASPTLVGYYTRVDVQLGVLLTRVDQTVFLVREPTP